MASLLNMSGRALVKMPYDAEIEYLGFTGTQWINTGLFPNVLNFDIVYESYNGLLFGWIAQNYQYNTWICVLGSSVFWKNFNSRYNFSNTDNNIFELWRFDMASGLYRNNSLLKSFSATLGRNQILQTPLYIGQPFDSTANKIDVSNQDFDKRVKYMKIYRGNLVRDYIPVRIGTTGYLYDKVSGQLFGNAGTGDFILGADKTN